MIDLEFKNITLAVAVKKRLWEKQEGQIRKIKYGASAVFLVRDGGGLVQVFRRVLDSRLGLRTYFISCLELGSSTHTEGHKIEKESKALFP